MYADTATTQTRYGKDEYGKCLCFSIPFHELSLIDEMDRNSHLELCHSRSQYLRRLVRRDSELKKKQMEENRLPDLSKVFTH